MEHFGISITKNSNITNLTLIDISKNALEIAKRNLIKNNVIIKCSVICSNLFENVNKNIKYDIIISNPPYIKTKDLDKLSDFVKKEPLLALDGGEDGLIFYRKILQEAKEFLNNNSVILFEIGYDQKGDIISLINQFKEYEVIECIQDLGMNDRVIVCRFHKI
ncbi:MAG: peptide chain release factor N(5)-glutamine methyltransferase [Clostridia bacterium]|nr:peptide chain release factor N(5)-glutamine methyltransferase [Clostridia bacterium]MDD4376057.1 peptide chain release factor N(5)-glutamine methyltransferase [Clostridia bacterium]